MSTFHFLSDLPRSGSTLLATILRQNPRFCADMSSSLPPLFTGAMYISPGGTGLSLREAPAVAASNAGPDTITFASTSRAAPSPSKVRSAPMAAICSSTRSYARG